MDITDASSRQLLKRAKQRLSKLQDYDPALIRAVVNEFIEALVDDDLDD